jgi:hypothetical protein
MKKFPKAAKNPNSRLRQSRKGGSANGYDTRKHGEASE